jgi:hypothetical protein
MRRHGELLSEAHDAVAEAVARAGFRSAGRWAYVRDLESGDGIRGYLGLPLAKHRDLIEANPVIGVVDPEVERMLRNLRNQRSRDIVRTFGQPLTNLREDGLHRSYSIINHDRVDSGAIERLVVDVERYGDPFIAGLAERASLTARIEREGLQNDKMYALPVLLLLNGEVSKAKKLVEKTQREAADLSVMARAQGRREFDYDRFAKNFLAYVQELSHA